MKVFIFVNHDATEWTMSESDAPQVDVDDRPMKLVGDFDDSPDPYYDDLTPEERDRRNIRRAYFDAFADGYRARMIESLPDDDGGVDEQFDSSDVDLGGEG